MRTLSHIECFVVGCSNQAAVQVNGDYMCLQCAKHEIPADFKTVVVDSYFPSPEEHAQTQANQLCGCGQLAADDIRYSGMCTTCYEMDQALECAEQEDRNRHSYLVQLG